MPADLVPTSVPAAPPGAGTAFIEAHDLTCVWGKGRSAQIGVAGVDLAIERGELVAIIGPPGSGKSTLAGALVCLPVLAVLIVRSTTRRPIAMTLRGAA